MAKEANDFYEAHGYQSDNHEPSKRPNGNMKQPTLNTVNHRNTQPPSVTHAGTRHCDKCGLTNYNTNECRRSRSNQNNTNSDIICFKCNRPGHRRLQCPMNVNRMAAMYQMNDREAAMCNYPYGEPHNCDESRGDGEVKLACGCMLPVVAGALSPNGQLKLQQWQTQMVPCSRGSINGKKPLMRDTGSTTCVVKKSLVKKEQMTGSYELCMLIDGIVKRYPTAKVELDTPYFKRQNQSFMYG